MKYIKTAILFAGCYLAYFTGQLKAHNNFLKTGAYRSGYDAGQKAYFNKSFNTKVWKDLDVIEKLNHEINLLNDQIKNLEDGHEEIAKTSYESGLADGRKAAAEKSAMRHLFEELHFNGLGPSTFDQDYKGIGEQMIRDSYISADEETDILTGTNNAIVD
jgi:glutathionyl-hydroquinone reductase